MFETKEDRYFSDPEKIFECWYCNEDIVEGDDYIKVGDDCHIHMDCCWEMKKTARRN